MQSKLQCGALFLKAPGRKEKQNNDEDASPNTPISVQPFVDGRLNESELEWHPIEATSIPVAENIQHEHTIASFATKGFVAVKLQRYFYTDNETRSSCFDADDDKVLRMAIERFWRSNDGITLLRSRFSTFNSTQCIVLQTHITHRRVPPDGMSLVHIDYPSSYDLSELTREWWSRWKDIISNHETVRANMPVHNSSQELLEPQVFSNLFDLVGVVTIWLCLQPNGETILNHPLLLADASTVHKDNSHIYRVGNRHSVGISFSSEEATNCSWFHAPRMSKGDAWIFDTTKCPHVSVDLNPDDGFERVSAEVRCLILNKK